MKKIIICIAVAALTMTACTQKKTDNTESSSDDTSVLSTQDTVSTEDDSSVISMSKTDESEDFFKFMVGDGGGRVGFKEAVAKVADSAVSITVSGVTGSYYYSYPTEVHGSGVIISENGFILTANHVVDGGTAVTVTTSDGKTHKADLVGGDKKTDVAVIKIEAEGLTPVKLSSSKGLSVGDFVFTTGSSGAVFGFVSAAERSVSYDNETRRMIQIDANVNKDNTGGGLYDSNGELVGIISALESSSLNGVGFALPSDTLMAAVEDLINHGYVRGRPCVGFEAVEISDMATATINGLTRLGVYVKSVSEGSSASECGMQFKDYIQAVDGESVNTLERLNEIIASKSIGDSLILEIVRGNNTIDMVLVIEEEHK